MAKFVSGDQPDQKHQHIGVLALALYNARTVSFHNLARVVEVSTVKALSEWFVSDCAESCIVRECICVEASEDSCHVVYKHRQSFGFLKSDLIASHQAL